MTNDKVYIHEFIDIIGHNRADYMHHMTADWSPLAQDERHQLCYGVWGVVGSTRNWPAVVNLWEEDGFDGLASSFRHELTGSGLQDPALAKWWAQAAEFGWVLAGAWETAMSADSEVMLLWAIPTWEQWSEAEKAERGDTKLGRWRRGLYDSLESGERFLLADSALSPFRTGRQPTREDRTDWVD